MTLEEAKSLLSGDAEMAEWLEAIGTIARHPDSSPQDLMLGLPHPELIAEQAALALYARTGRPLPKDRSKIATAPEDWTAWLLENGAASLDSLDDSSGVTPLRKTSRRHRTP